MVKSVITYRDFSGGLTELANDNMADNQLVKAVNTMPGEYAGISKASGYKPAFVKNESIQIVGDGSKPVMQLLDAEFTVNGQTVMQTLAFTDNALYRLDSNGWTRVIDDIGKITDYFVYGKKLYWLNGSAYRVYDGSSAGNVTQEGSGTVYTFTADADGLPVGDYNMLVGVNYINFTTTANLSNGQTLVYNSGTRVLFMKRGWVTTYLSFTQSPIAEGDTLETTRDNTPTPEEAELWEKIKAATFVEQRGQRWFFATRGQDEVLFTEIGNPARVQATSILNINSKNSDHITGLQEFNNGLLIFKERSVHYLTGYDFAAASDIQITQLNVTSGTKFNNSICVVDNAVLYVGYDGIYRLYLPYYSSVVASTNISLNQLSKTIYDFQPTDAYAVVWRNVYYFTLVNATERKEYRYLIKEKTYWGPFTQDHDSYSTSMSEKNLYLGCKAGLCLVSDESVFHYIATESMGPVSAGGAIPIVMECETKGFDVTKLGVRDAKMKRIEVAAKQYLEESSDFDLQVICDYSVMQFAFALDESLVYGEGDYGDTYYGWKDVVVKEATINRKSKRIKFIVMAGEIDQPVLIYAFGVLFKPKKVKGSREGVSPVSVIYD